MARTAILINPNARRNRRKPERIQRMKRIVEAGGGTAFVTQSLDELEEAAKQVAHDNFEVIAISGGDGSLHACAGALVRAGCRLPYMAFVPSGTMNMLAISLEVPHKFSLLEHIVQAPLQQLQTVDRDLLHINHEKFGVMFGIGLTAQFLRAYYDMGANGGISAAKLLSKFIVSAAKRSQFAADLVAPVACTIHLDGQLLEQPHCSALILQTTENLALGFTPMYRANEKNGTFHVIATDLNAAALVNRIDHLFRGIPWNNPRVHDAIGSELQIQFENESWFQVDGEVYPAPRKLTVGIQQTLQFVVG